MVKPLIEILAEIPDFRKAKGKRHPLSAILAMALEYGYPLGILPFLYSLVKERIELSLPDGKHRHSVTL